MAELQNVVANFTAKVSGMNSSNFENTNKKMWEKEGVFKNDKNEWIWVKNIDIIIWF